MTDSLTRKRGSLKSSLTNFVKHVDSKKDLDKLSETDLIQLEERLDRVKIVFDEFEEVQNHIELAASEEALQKEYEIRATFEDTYYNYRSIAKSLLASKVIVDFNSQISSRNSAVSETGSPTSILSGVKLPVIALPKFQGKYENWLEFRETFESLVHSNESLSSIQKYHYLRASLEGSAALVIKAVEFTSAGYTVAWQVLCDRYNNTRLLVHNHIKLIFGLESITKESSYKLRKLVDDLSKHLRSLEQLEQNTKNWDPLLIFLASSKLDAKTLSEWEKHSLSCDNPTLENLQTFLRNRADLLETLEFKSGSSRYVADENKRKDFRQSSKSLVSNNSTALSCFFCKDSHSIYKCESFLGLSLEKRIEFVKQANLCNICLLNNHSSKKCRSGPCKKCKAWHNTLLHPENEYTAVTKESGSSSNNVNSLASGVDVLNNHTVLLSTAKVIVFDESNQPVSVRALLDSGSQSSFITDSLRQRLGISTSNASLNVLGISGNISKIKEKCVVDLNSRYGKFKASVNCFVLSNITSMTPAWGFDVSSLKIPSDLQLADPEFNKPAPIDMLIGAELFWEIIKPNKISCGRNKPVLQDTVFGWIVSGRVSNDNNVRNTSCHLSTNQELCRILSKFWETEECSVVKPWSREEIECETIFEQTTRRDSSGRFIVTLPLKQHPSCLGESRSQAQKLFHSTERKLSKNESLKILYTNFLSEYIDLNHMSLAEEQINDDVCEYFMPHHGILRENSKTTRLRVVFNASFPTSNGISLNNIQYIGPILQEDLLSIILRFRQHKYVISADCAKMYRQVLIEPSQRNLQKILWRDSPDQPLKSYTLNTVTYGQACASYLAIRCLFELAKVCQDSQPYIAEIIRRDFYVDDLLTGADTIEHAQSICAEVSSVLLSGCFELRKWYSNEPEVLANIDSKDSPCGIIEFGPGENAKTLGLTWSCHNDELLYTLENLDVGSRCTKRLILSVNAKIFDPLGLVSPSIIITKILMQSLWLEKLGWDDALPRHLADRWFRFLNDLPNLEKISISRRVVCDNPQRIELHGYCDASERAFGACLYVRSIDVEGKIHVHLLTAKSKVAPIKTISVPCLELCGALVLSRLADKVKKSMTLKFDECFLWSDSQIVLAWISASPSSLKVFVANRVAEIQGLTANCEWRYVPTRDNPADLVSRGLYPSELLESQLWWRGPTWLCLEKGNWPNHTYAVVNLPELRQQTCVAIKECQETLFPFERFSSYTHLLRTVAYMLRFAKNCRTFQTERVFGCLSKQELNRARTILLKISQIQSFPREVSDLSQHRKINGKSKLLSLTPFSDSAGLIRVGGRLEYSDLSFNKKHPIVLDCAHHLTKLLFSYEHLRNQHVGPHSLLAFIREEFWPIGGRNMARSIVRKCIRCARHRGETVQPLMGNLPRERIVPSPPFSCVGVDYAGPFIIRHGLSRGRGGKLDYLSALLQRLCISN
ncbi:uncharacterized protein LOC123322380 [Coccinella septempunctata]|uniref:uncharacterized protein LOC123322380 n=1 Tax=Coccinella septempunctata TaxID=41139 RepID=UPI001D07EBAC|nr:uncharacterized protein LOC123322380 [Coccinella septempunctata]